MPTMLRHELQRRHRRGDSIAVSVPSRLWFPLWLCCCFASRSCQAPVKITNHRPIIGVLSQETVGDLRELGRTYIAASYVKFVEAGGARVVPIRVNLTESEYTDLFNSLNGVVFPGGDVDIEESAYAKASKLLFDLALQANERGDYFPVWGVCLGLEELSFLTSGENLLTLTHTKDIALPLNFTRESRQSKLFQNFPKHILDTLASEPITSNLHSWSLSLKGLRRWLNGNAFAACCRQKNHRPIIGVLCQETVTGLSALGPSYIAASVRQVLGVRRFQGSSHQGGFEQE
ncbi:unnamed protein product [Lampetra fluviatilis]